MGSPLISIRHHDIRQAVLTQVVPKLSFHVGHVVVYL